MTISIKLGYSLLLLILITLLFSCSRSSHRINQQHSKIQLGMGKDQVQKKLGEPQNRQFKGVHETWQYCLSGLLTHNYYSVDFVEGQVEGISTYSKKVEDYDSCIKCDRCFDEIRFSNTSNRQSLFQSDLRIRDTKEILTDGIVDGIDSPQDYPKRSQSQSEKTNTPTSYNPEEKEFVERLSNTELVEVVAKFGPGSQVPIFIDESKLPSLVQRINSEPAGTYLLVGHTNSQGGHFGNMNLSNDRAAAVFVVFEKEYDLDVDKLVFGGAGEELPLDDNSTSIGRRNNSRVELRRVINK